uniref:Putative secreted protein n=1 Tax=Amblyomma americanum TaxID=6943 RepID=A0A0C9R461_AMBAM
MHKKRMRSPAVLLCIAVALHLWGNAAASHPQKPADPGEPESNVEGRPCTASSDCSSPENYCCVVHRQLQETGQCKRRPVLVFVCYRSIADRCESGVCQHYTDARPGG